MGLILSQDKKTLFKCLYGLSPRCGLGPFLKPSFVLRIGLFQLCRKCRLSCMSANRQTEPQPEPKPELKSEYQTEPKPQPG